MNGEDVKPDSSTAAGSDIVALGTASGSILLYSLNRAELVHELTGGHNGKVHSLCWNSDGTSLFSSSSDSKIIEWNALEGGIRRYTKLILLSIVKKKLHIITTLFLFISQWKVNSGKVCRLALLQDGVTLVTAGRSIQCWNANDDSKIRSEVATFAGHTTNISQVEPVVLPGDKGGYFLTSAQSDRCISAW